MTFHEKHPNECILRQLVNSALKHIVKAARRADDPTCAMS